jgi:methanogenic corrinoid protein MtbC1
MQTGDLQEHSNCGLDGHEASALPALQDFLSEPEGGTIADESLAKIARTVESEIVPRLMLVRRGMSRPATSASVSHVDCDAAEVTELVRLLMVHDFPFAYAYVETIRQRGMGVQNICLQLLAPAARQLGTYWEEDRATIIEVTLGLCRLHQVLHRLCADFAPPAETAENSGFRALLACPPGEQHTFGAIMVGQFLRRGGWDVWNEFPSNSEALLETVQGNSFRIVGLSVGSERMIDELPLLIRNIRRLSRNREVAVLLGGPLTSEIPNLATRLGADGAGMDGRETLRWAQARFPDSTRTVRRG